MRIVLIVFLLFSLLTKHIFAQSEDDCVSTINKHQTNLLTLINGKKPYNRSTLEHEAHAILHNATLFEKNYQSLCNAVYDEYALALNTLSFSNQQIFDELIMHCGIARISDVIRSLFVAEFVQHTNALIATTTQPTYDQLIQATKDIYQAFQQLTQIVLQNFPECQPKPTKSALRKRWLCITMIIVLIIGIIVFVYQKHRDSTEETPAQSTKPKEPPAPTVNKQHRHHRPKPTRTAADSNTCTDKNNKQQEGTALVTKMDDLKGTVGKQVPGFGLIEVVNATVRTLKKPPKPDTSEQ